MVLMGVAFALNATAFILVARFATSIQITRFSSVLIGALVVSALCVPVFFALLFMTMGTGLSWVSVLALGASYVAISCGLFMAAIKFLPGLQATSFSALALAGLLYGLVSVAIATARLFLGSAQ